MGVKFEPSQLPCGCLRGGIACKKALDLTLHVEEAFLDGLRTGHWRTFNDLRSLLEEHYGTPPRRSCSVEHKRPIRSHGEHLPHAKN